MSERVLSRLLLAVLCFAALASGAGAQGPETAIVERLADLDIPVEGVEISGDRVTVVCDLVDTIPEEAVLLTFATIASIAAEEVPGAEQVAARVSFRQEPMVELSIARDDLLAFQFGLMSEESLLDAIGASDLRRPADAIQQNLALLGLHASAIEFSQGELHLTMVQPQVASSEELLSTWLQAFDSTVAKLPPAGVDRVTLHLLLRSGDPVDVSMAVEDTRAFQRGELPAADYLARLVIERAAPAPDAAPEPEQPPRITVPGPQALPRDPALDFGPME